VRRQNDGVMKDEMRLVLMLLIKIDLVICLVWPHSTSETSGQRHREAHPTVSDFTA